MSPRAALALVAIAITACLEHGSEHLEDRPSRRDASPALEQPATRIGPSSAADPNAEIRIRLEAEPSHLNPFLTGDGLALRVTLGDVYEGLLCREAPMAPVTPCLATSFEADASGTTWSFELRAGVKFHDGRELVADDVIRSIEAVARQQVPTPLSSELSDLQSVTASADGKRITVQFAERRLDRIGTFARLPIASASYLQGDLSDMASRAISRAPVGTGPLRFSTWREGEAILLTRHRAYWGTASAAKTIRYLIVGSRERAYAMARNGKLDVAPQLPVSEALDIASLSSELQVYTYRRPAYLAAVFNGRAGRIDSPAARRGLTMLLDRKAVIGAVMAGYGDPLTGPYIGAQRDPSVVRLPFDRAAAAEAIGRSMALEILYPVKSRTMARVADIWAADAAGVVELAPRPLPFAKVLSRARSGEFDIVLLAFTTGDELDMFSRLHSSEIGGENYGAIADVELDAHLVAVRRAGSRAELVAASRAAHRRLAELGVYAFISTDVRAGLVAKEIGGLEIGDGLSARRLWRGAP